MSELLDKDFPLSSSGGSNQDIVLGDDTLYISYDMYRISRSLNIKSATSLLSYLQTFPAPFASSLDIDLKELNIIYNKLVSVLKGKISEKYLDRQNMTFSLGVNNF